jgi:hypothetical protein
MTTLTVSDVTTRRVAPAATRVDRALLRAADALGSHVLARLGRRAGLERRRALTVQARVDAVRREAAARAAIGILPR